MGLVKLFHFFCALDFLQIFYSNSLVCCPIFQHMPVAFCPDPEWTQGVLAGPGVLGL